MACRQQDPFQPGGSHWQEVWASGATRYIGVWVGVHASFMPCTFTARVVPRTTLRAPAVPSLGARCMCTPYEVLAGHPTGESYSTLEAVTGTVGKYLGLADAATRSVLSPHRARCQISHMRPGIFGPTVTLSTSVGAPCGLQVYEAWCCVDLFAGITRLNRPSSLSVSALTLILCRYPSVTQIASLPSSPI